MAIATSGVLDARELLAVSKSKVGENDTAKMEAELCRSKQLVGATELIFKVQLKRPQNLRPFSFSELEFTIPDS
jgi:hypothetical protein